MIDGNRRVFFVVIITSIKLVYSLYFFRNREGNKRLRTLPIRYKFSKNLSHTNENKRNYVFLFFFLAAGNNMLFRISRYPGELGCKLRSVGGSPTKC